MNSVLSRLVGIATSFEILCLLTGWKFLQVILRIGPPQGALQRIVPTRQRRLVLGMIQTTCLFGCSMCWNLLRVKGEK